MKTVAIIILIVVLEIAAMFWLAGCAASPVKSAPTPAPVAFEKQSSSQPAPHQYVVRLDWDYPELPDTIDHYEAQGSTNLFDWNVLRLVNNQSNSCVVTSLWSSTYFRLNAIGTN